MRKMWGMSFRGFGIVVILREERYWWILCRKVLFVDGEEFCRMDWDISYEWVCNCRVSGEKRR